MSSPRPCATTWRRYRPNSGCSPSVTGWLTWRARSSASARSAPRRTSSCSSATTSVPRSSCRPRKPAAVLEAYTEPHLHEHQGERVVFGQRLMQAASDPFLGWFRGSGPRGLDYYVRQLRDGKASFEISTLFPSGLIRYVEVCGQVLAHAHARSGEAPAIAGYVGAGKAFDNAVEEFAVRYANQTVDDH